MRPSHLVAGLTLCAAALITACDNAVAPRPPVDSATPGFSNGLKLGQCFLQADGVAAPQVAPGADGNATVSAPAGQVVTQVAIKAGTVCWFTPQGATGTSTIEIGGAPCYIVAGLGTATATVTRVGAGPVCKDISHVESVNGAPPPVTGMLQICVMVVGNNPPPITLTQQYVFHVAGQDIAVAHQHCSTAVELPVGQVVIAEEPPEFVFLSNAVSVPVGRVIDIDVPNQTATVTVHPGETTVVTITNLWVEDPGGD